MLIQSNLGDISNKSKTLTFDLVQKVDPDIKADVIRWSAFYEHRIHLGSVSSNGIDVILLGVLTIAPESNYSSRGICCQIYEINGEVSYFHVYLKQKLTVHSHAMGIDF